MIKIIKPGKTDFRMTCNKCGCIFEYNVEDINDSYIKCPTCHKEYYGFEPECLEKTLFDTGLAECEPTGPLGEPGSLKTLPGESIYQSLNSCEGCPTYKQICSPTGYIGDLPCQWCNKSPWKVTCDTTTYTTSAGNETRGARSWVTTNTTAFSETEDMKITCKAEGVEYTTVLEDYPNTFISEDTQYTFTESISEPYTSCSDNMKEYYTICENANGGTWSEEKE